MTEPGTIDGTPDNLHGYRDGSIEEEVRTYIRVHAANVDKALAGVDLSSPASVARWLELQAREREERSFDLTKRAVFRGTFAAHFVLALITFALWLFIVFIFPLTV